MEYIVKEKKLDDEVVDQIKTMVKNDNFKKIESLKDAHCLEAINELILIINEQKINNKELEKKILELESDRDYRKQFVHILCHDLLNPIGTSLAFLEVVEEDTDTSAIPFFVEIKNGIKYSVDIIKEVQQLLSLQDGKLKVDLGYFNLYSLIRESLKMLEQKIKTKNVTIELDVDQSAKILTNESFAVLSVFNNVLTNAIKFTQPGGIIKINTVLSDWVVSLEITDFGIGIPESILNHIFESSSKTSRIGTSGEKGTGFGMPLVKKFMESFEGQINIESSEDPKDHGTKVKLQFWKDPSR